MAALSHKANILLIHPVEGDLSPVHRVLDQIAVGWDSLPKPGDSSLLELVQDRSDHVLLWWCDDITLATHAELRRFRQEAPAQPLVLLAVSPDAETVTDLYQAGASEVVSLDRAEEILPRSLRHQLLRLNQLRKLLFRSRLSGQEAGFIQGAARLLHDINSPTTAIQNTLDMMEMERRKEGHDPSTREKLLFSSVEHLRGVIDHWHDMLYRPPEEMTSVNLYQSLRLVLELLRDESGDISLETTPEELHPDHAGPLPEILLHSDPFALAQIFHHIVQNAFEALSSLDDPRIRVDVEVDEKEIHICFDNNGPPVSPELATTLWKDFITDKAGHSGMGLGVVRYLLMQLGGSIALGESHLGGACFVITFRRRATRQVTF